VLYVMYRVKVSCTYTNRILYYIHQSKLFIITPKVCVCVCVCYCCKSGARGGTTCQRSRRKNQIDNATQRFLNRSYRHFLIFIMCVLIIYIYTHGISAHSCILYTDRMPASVYARIHTNNDNKKQ